jgi:hypothetical protein
LLVACGGDAAATPDPIVDLIPDAVAAVETHYGSPQRYFEISAGLDRVRFVVAVDDATAAEQGSYSAEDGLTAPQSVGEASGATFTVDQIDVDPDRIFDELRDELDDPVIVDFAVQGGPNGTVVYDATVASDSGGVLRVFLGPDGQIQGARGQ